MAEALVPSNSTEISNQCLPGEKPKVMRGHAVWGAVDEYTINLVTEVQQGKIKAVQTLYVDNFSNDAPAIITIDNVSQRLVIPLGWQGYIPVVMPDPPSFVISSQGSGYTTFHMINVPMPAFLWNAIP